jgi:hypothetical protein
MYQESHEQGIGYSLMICPFKYGHDYSELKKHS